MTLGIEPIKTGARSEGIWSVCGDGAMALIRKN